MVAEQLPVCPLTNAKCPPLWWLRRPTQNGSSRSWKESTATRPKFISRLRTDSRCARAFVRIVASAIRLAIRDASSNVMRYVSAGQSAR